jgi:hypothetical protein
MDLSALAIRCFQFCHAFGVVTPRSALRQRWTATTVKVAIRHCDEQYLAGPSAALRLSAVEFRRPAQSWNDALRFGDPTRRGGGEQLNGGGVDRAVPALASTIDAPVCVLN